MVTGVGRYEMELGSVVMSEESGLLFLFTTFCYWVGWQQVHDGRCE